MVNYLETLYFKDIDEFCSDVLNRFENLTDNFDNISIVAKYGEAKDIIEDLVISGFELASIRLDQPDYDNYYDEFIVSICSMSDGTHEVWCEPFKRDGEYFTDDSTITYISNECSSKVIPHVESALVYAFEIECDEDEDEDVCECDNCKTCNVKESDELAHIFSDSDLRSGECYGDIISIDDPCDGRYACLIFNRLGDLIGYKCLCVDDYSVSQSEVRCTDRELITKDICKFFE